MYQLYEQSTKHFCQTLIENICFTRPQGSNRRRTITPANSTVPTFMKDIYESLINHAGDQEPVSHIKVLL